MHGTTLFLRARDHPLERAPGRDRQVRKIRIGKAERNVKEIVLTEIDHGESDAYGIQDEERDCLGIFLSDKESGEEGIRSVE
jgi:hypothetical protein